LPVQAPAQVPAPVEAVAEVSPVSDVSSTEAELGSPTAADAEDSSDPAAAGTPAAEAGLFGRIKERVGEKVAPTMQRLAESERVQKSVEWAKEKGQQVTESERYQQSVEWAKRKTTELSESERLQRGVDMYKDTAKVVSERTSQTIEAVKERTKAVGERAGNVWSNGRGHIQRIRTEGVSAVAWKGSARDTLENAAREEQWKGIKIQGAEELAVPARTEHTCAYHVSKGSTLRWTFRVKDHDIGFAVRMRIQVWGGSQEEEVLSIERYDNADTISGSWVADEDRTMILAFDNRYSKLRSKTVAYLVGTEKPPVFTEAVPREESPVAQPEAAVQRAMV